MPLYEYQCPKCGNFEKIHKFSDAPMTKCPTCGSDVQKLFSAPAIQFKGTGWYITDYARKSDGKGGKDGKGESGKGESGKSEGSKSEGSGKEGSSKEGSKSESSKSDGAKSESSKSEGSKGSGGSGQSKTAASSGGGKDSGSGKS